MDITTTGESVSDKEEDYLLKGNTLTREEKWAETDAAYTKGIELGKHNIDKDYLQKANSLTSQKKWEEAAATYKKGMELCQNIRKLEDALLECKEKSAKALFTALFTAIKTNCSKTTEKLLKDGADVNTVDEYGWLPIHYAAVKRHTDLFKMLQNNGSRINSWGSKHWKNRTPLHEQCEYKVCGMDVVDQLIKAEMLAQGFASFISPVDIEGQTPLHTAVRYGNDSMVEYLLKQPGVDISAQDNRGETPLHLAARWGLKTTVKCLLKHPSVDVSVTANHGSKAADGAKLYKHLEIVEMLQQFEKQQGQQHKKKMYIMDFTISKRKKGTKMQSIERYSSDSRKLRATFEGLGYEVNLLENKNQVETNEFLDSIQQDKSLKFLVLFILSFGNDKDTFLTLEGAKNSLRDVQYRFTDDKCPQLKGKPKAILTHFWIDEIPTVDQIIDNGEAPPTNMITTNFYNNVGGLTFAEIMCNVLKERSILPIQEIFNVIYAEGKWKASPEMTVSAPFPIFKF